MGYARKRPHTASNNALRTALVVCVMAAIVLVMIFLDSHYVCYGGEVYKRENTSIELRGSREIDIDRLCKMESLEYIDLRDSVLTTEQADEIGERLPECRLVWSVPIAGRIHDSDSKKLELKAPTEDDLEMLRFFDGLTELSVTDCEEYEWLMEYSRAMTGCEVRWTVPLCGETYSSEETDLVLPDAEKKDFQLLEYMPNLLSVDFTGCTEYDSILEFAANAPECDVKWEVELLGTKIGSEETEVDLSGTKVEDPDELDRLLDYLPRLEKLIICDCGLSNEKLDELNRKHESVKIVWRVYFGKWSLRTDATAFSTLNGDPPSYRLVDKEVSVLRYCTDLEMLDLGHNAITSVEPFADLTNLKVLILADNRITDISGLYKLTKMEYIEMFINGITDISVLEYMPNLTDVNFCWNWISDPSVLYEHEHLERVWMCGGGMSGATKREFMNKRPDVEFDLYSTYGSTNGSWRYNDHFEKIRDGFRNHNGKNDYHW